MREKIADFINSKLGAFILYGAVFTMPIGGAVFLYDHITPDMDETTNEISQTATTEYLSENKSLISLYEDMNALSNASDNQQGAENILSVRDAERKLKEQLIQGTSDFTKNVLNDNRITELDYERIEEAFYLDNRADIEKLSDEANALSECRIEAKPLDINECMEGYRSGSRLFIPISLFSLVIICTMLGAIIEGFENKDSRKKLANRIKHGHKNISH